MEHSKSYMSVISKKTFKHWISKNQTLPQVNDSRYIVFLKLDLSEFIEELGANFTFSRCFYPMYKVEAVHLNTQGRHFSGFEFPVGALSVHSFNKTWFAKRAI